MNRWAVNGRDTTTYLTGDVNGPTLVWKDQAGPSTSTWSKLTV